jgi:alkyl hydroperoxide reductase subunit AhpC
MTLRIGDTAPNFQADTTEGKVDFHQWIGDKWAVLFSHPKDFTPVCTTELGYMARIKPEFDRRNAKIIGLSADPVDDHKKWSKDIQETQGTAPNYPMIGDPELKVAKLYDMLPAEAVPGKRTAADNATVRTVFIVGPDKKIKLMLFYPMTTGRNPARARLDAAHREAQGRHSGELETRPGRDHRGLGQRRRREEALPEGLESPQALSENHRAAEIVRNNWSPLGWHRACNLLS